MLTDEKGAKLTPFEEALLDNYDGKIALVLINGDRNGYCDLTEAFVATLYRKVWQDEAESAVVSKIMACSDFLTEKVVDAIFETEDEAQIAAYLHSSRGFGMDSKHIIELLQLGFEEEIDFFFKRNASIVLQDGWYLPVVNYLKESGRYAAFKNKYMPRKEFGSVLS